MRDGRGRLIAALGALLLVAALALIDVAVTATHSTGTTTTARPPTKVGSSNASPPAAIPTSGPRATAAVIAQAKSKIKHVVFVLLENHSFDNLFGTYPGADGATTAKMGGSTIPMLHAPPFYWHDIDHDQPDARQAMNNGGMNEFNLPDGGNLNGDMMAYTQYQRSDIPNLWSYAQNYVLGDHMFSSVAGSTFPNHLYSVAAQAGGVLSNVQGVGGVWGCDSGPKAFVTARDPKTGKTIGLKPCFSFTNLADVMNKAGVSWNYYADPPPHLGYIWSTLDAFKSIRYSASWKTNVKDQLTFQSDARAGKLPAFSWLTPQYHESGHSPLGICPAQDWFVQNVNAVMQGPDWSSTAVYLVFDDYGGFYDHVTPPVSDPLGFGPRVPMLLISPYAKHGYVSHTTYNFTSVLRTFEEIHGLSPMTDGDARASDTLDAFDFSQTVKPGLVQKPATCPTEPGQAQYAQYLPEALAQALTYTLRLSMPRIVTLHAHQTIAQIAAAQHVTVKALATAMQDAVKNWANSAQLRDLLSNAGSGDIQNSYRQTKIPNFINMAPGTALTPFVSTGSQISLLPHGVPVTNGAAVARSGALASTGTGAAAKNPKASWPAAPRSKAKAPHSPNFD